MIYLAANQSEKAKTHLQRAFAENLSLHPLYAAEAQQALSKMMDKDYAMK
jgi:hypothetical protein